MSAALAAADLAQIEAHGLDAKEAARQIELLRRPPAPPRLLRPATVGDGISRLAEADHTELLAAFDTAARAGRWARFVPASGAASRMFRSLVAVYEGTADDADRTEADRFLERLDELPFRAELARAIGQRGGELAQARSRGDLETILGALLADPTGDGSASEDAGLGYAGLPKALIPFHRYAKGNRTPIAEHLAEAAVHLADSSGTCRLHFTTPPGQDEHFRRGLAVAENLEERFGVRFDLTVSSQLEATDTLALADDGSLFRDSAGRLLFRPGGHGALLANLEAGGFDLVFIKNIDNVVPETDQGLVVRWKRLLGGLLVTLEARIEAILATLDDGRDGATFRADSLRFAADELAAPGAAALVDAAAEAQRAYLVDRLARPLRICGMVPLTGEPGGGPFWVGGADGPSLQIVEAAQVDVNAADQRAALEASTHFSPVDIVCRLRPFQRAGGSPFVDRRLADLVDESGAIVRHRSAFGRALVALERPGLWNGAMAGWNTVFVEVPGATFAPVKTVFDLLRPEHRRADV